MLRTLGAHGPEVVSERSAIREFASGHELLESIAGDLLASLREPPGTDRDESPTVR